MPSCRLRRLDAPLIVLICTDGQNVQVFGEGGGSHFIVYIIFAGLSSGLRPPNLGGGGHVEGDQTWVHAPAVPGRGVLPGWSTAAEQVQAEP